MIDYLLRNVSTRLKFEDVLFLPSIDGVDDGADGDNDVPDEVDGCRLTSRLRI